MNRTNERTRRSRRWLTGLALAVCGAAVAITGAPASATPEAVNGHFTLRNSSGSGCESPVGVCMTGSVTGRIKGSFSFTATSVIATADTPTTGVIVTTGDAMVQTNRGTISCKLTGTLQVTDEGPFVSLCVITGGTDGWATATGYLRTSGTFSLASGGSGSYDGKVVGAAE